MPKYTVRTEQVEGGWGAHIDQDGLICIMQPNLPGLEGNFATEADAKAWADNHAASLEANYNEAIAQATLKKEREEAAHQANLAMVAILERLTNPSA